ncbi:GPI ethanolamine phosphate transferase 1-like [Diabrotica undecimpunctata]|uniref:GPI ethanolamine phosphate transferase 1-like n=1 Tax=Diabrotica undecimpunctata TaxID=50387 RepID=UPI003B6349CA
MEEESEADEKNKKYTIIVSGLVIHFLLLLAVFDVYFASPLDNGMSPIRSTSNPPAKRLVLFVADGLRAEAIFGEEKEELIPFLTDKSKNVGSWGVAHTRVPTESRPGHVAMLAGIYEDPSAILKGWKSNPVNFDSVINQSTNAWAWGSPDIVKIFNKDKLSKIHISSYDAQIEDFGKQDTGILDTWVFEKVNVFLKNEVKSCTPDCDQYFTSGNTFFLHLLGIDTAGHGYKPHSKEYKDNIRLVDRNIAIITELFNNVYQDGLTAFVFTADHGMTDWGSHGAGTDHETEVPVIAWGAGIEKNDKRQDINQIDLAPMLASLIGIHIPINSLGILPVNYINSSQENKAQMMKSNVLELFEIYNRKKLRTKSGALFYIPFKYDEFINEKLQQLQSLNTESQTDYLIFECQNLIKVLISGVNYYHNYYQYPVLLTVSLGFILWVIFLCLSVFGIKRRKVTNKTLDLIVFLLVIGTTFLCAKSQFSYTYYLYFNFPILVFFLLLKDREFDKFPLQLTYTNIVQVVYYIIGIELMVYGFYNRLSFSVIMILIASWINISKSLRTSSSYAEKTTWVVCSIILAIFPCLPVMRTSFNLPIYIAGYVGYLMIFIKMYFYDLNRYSQLSSLQLHYRIYLLQFFFLQIAAVYVLLIEFEYIPSDSILKGVSWVIFIFPILVIPLTDKYVALRLVATVFGFAPFYLMVSPNYEVLFSVFYILLLYTWLLIESKTFKYESSHKLIYFMRFEHYKSESSVNTDDFRRAFLFVVFIFVGFFGTGNIASMNSFDPMWVRAFLTVFSPFKMMGLILLKFIVPFIFTCSIFRAINEVGKQNVMNIFCIILIFSDLMVLQFLYLITNVGSWLDIGTSLSHFIIMDSFVTMLLLLYGFAYWLMSIKY